MEDGASEFSDDWEVLSAASGPGGGGGGAGDDDDDGVLVSGEGGDVLHDHFALVPSSPAAEGSWSEADEDDGLGLLDRFDSIARDGMDLVAVVDSSARSRLGGVDETAEGSVLGARVACGGAPWSAEEWRSGASHAEIEAARSCGDWDSILPAAYQEVGGIVDFNATAVAGAGFQIEVAENYTVQLEDGGGADATSESSVLEAAGTGDAMQGGAQEESEEGKDASAASGCGESDGEGNDASSPLVKTPAPGEGGRQVVVWWRLPFKLLHFCAWKVRPVWSISIAAAFLGLVVLGRRMYRMRRKTRGIPQIKIAFDDKRASQFAERAARLNEAFLIAKRVPALRTSSGAVLPWSMVQER